MLSMKWMILRTCGCLAGKRLWCGRAPVASNAVIVEALRYANSKTRTDRVALNSKPWILSTLVICLLFPSFAIAKKFTIVTEPVLDGRIFVNGKYVGVSPVTVELKVRQSHPLVITAEKPGAIMEEPRRITSSQQTRIVVRLVASTKQYSIVTQPIADGRISVNGEFVGVAPVLLNLSITETEPITIKAEKPGAVGAWPQRVSPSISDTNTTIVVRLEADEALLATEESDISNNWITITPHRTTNDFGQPDTDKIWQKLVSLVTDNFPDLEQIDRASYYIRSAWRVREYPFRVLRHRLVLKRGVSDEFTLRVLLESQVAPTIEGSYREAEFSPIRRIFRIDSETIDFLRDQL